MAIASRSAMQSSSSNSATASRSTRNDPDETQPNETGPMKLAGSMTRLGTETAFDVLVRARALEAQGRDIIHLEIGEPDFNTPRHIVDAGKAALDEGWTHYGPTQGLPELRPAIAAHVTAPRNVRLGP